MIKAVTITYINSLYCHERDWKCQSFTEYLLSSAMWISLGQWVIGKARRVIFCSRTISCYINKGVDNEMSLNGVFDSLGNLNFTVFWMSLSTEAICSGRLD